MKRFSPLVVLFVVVIALSVACDRDDTSSVDETEQAVEESTETSDGVDHSSATDLYQNLGQTMIARPIGTMNQFVEIGCECDFEDLGYDTQEACLNDRSLTQSQLDEAADCTAESATEQDRLPPEGLDETLSCLSGLVDDVQECMSTVGEEVGCSEETEEAYAVCFQDLAMILRGGYELCTEEEGPDEDLLAWFEDLAETMNERGCFEPLRQLDHP